MKQLVRSFLLVLLIPILASIVFWLFAVDNVYSFSDMFILFFNLFYAAISWLIYYTVFDVRFYSTPVSAYIDFFYSYEWWIIFIWQLIIDFLLLYVFYYFNKTKYIYAVFIIVFKIIFALTVGSNLI